jgi:hypothetical protein
MEKTHHLLTRKGVTVGHFQTDTVFVDGVPHLIFEWAVTPQGEIPAFSVRLDPKHLSELNWPNCKYLYSLPVEDPREIGYMNPRIFPLSSVETHMNQKCKFLNLRNAITSFPNDKRLLWHVNRFQNYQAIRHDFMKAHNLIGEVINFQNQQELLASPFLFSAGWFYAVILYARWFKATENRIRLEESFFENRNDLLSKHRYFIDLRDKYIAHYEKEMIGKTEIYLTYDLNGSLLQLSPISLEVYVQSKNDLYDLSNLIEYVHNKITKTLLPKYENELTEYLLSKPEAAKLFEQAQDPSEVCESNSQNPYSYETGFDFDEAL